MASPKPLDGHVETSPLSALIFSQPTELDAFGHLAALTRSNAVTIAATCAAITSVVAGFPVREPIANSRKRSMPY